MKNLLLPLISVLLLVAEVATAKPRSIPAAHTVALNALQDAVEVAIEGAATTAYTTPVIPIHIAIKEQKTIGEIRGLLTGARFGGTDKIHPEISPSACEAILNFVVTTTHGRKVQFMLIQGDDLLIPQLRESKSADPNFIFSLGKMLLHIQHGGNPQH